jgi:hypothetical protein
VNLKSPLDLFRSYSLQRGLLTVELLVLNDLFLYIRVEIIQSSILILSNYMFGVIHGWRHIIFLWVKLLCKVLCFLLVVKIIVSLTFVILLIFIVSGV